MENTTLVHEQLAMNDIKALTNLFNAIGSIKEEGHLKLTEEGLKFTEMDDSHICLVDMLISKEDMDTFNFNKGKEMGINLSDFVKFLKRGKKEDQMVLDFGDKKNLILNLRNEEKNKNRKYSIPLLDLEKEEIDPNSLDMLEFNNSVQLHFTDLKEVLGDIEILSDAVGIDIKNENLVFSSEGNCGKYENIIENANLLEFHGDCDSEGIFSLEFLQNIIKSGSIFGTANSKSYKNAGFELSLASDLPLKFEVLLFNNSYLRYYLAPRTEDDNEEDDDYDDFGRKKEEEISIVEEIQKDLEYELELNEKERVFDDIEKEISEYSALIIERRNLINKKEKRLEKNQKRVNKLVSKGEYEKVKELVITMQNLNKNINLQNEKVYDLKVNIFNLEEKFRNNYF